MVRKIEGFYLLSGYSLSEISTPQHSLPASNLLGEIRILHHNHSRCQFLTDAIFLQEYILKIPVPLPAGYEGNQNRSCKSSVQGCIAFQL